MDRRRIGLAFLVLSSGACAASEVLDAEALGEPLVHGAVESIDHRATASGILVRALPGSREMCGIAATVDSTTRFYRRAAGGVLSAADARDLTVGDTVEVFVNGPAGQGRRDRHRGAVEDEGGKTSVPVRRGGLRGLRPHGHAAFLPLPRVPEPQACGAQAFSPSVYGTQGSNRPGAST
jgi:hypothetical protein